MPFALNNSPQLSEVADAINYLLGNFGANIAADPVSGEITGPTGIVIAYLYRYLAVKYADSADGSLNFSNSPTNRAYYGLRNTNDTVESINPADYIWNKVAGAGFGTTKFLFYQTNGGRQINFVVATSAPDATYLQEAGPVIDLDIITEAAAAQTTAENKLSKIGADNLQGPISLNTATSILVGTTTDGVAIGSTGIIGKKAGVTTFSVNNTGDAVFGGSLNAATGSFTGNITGAANINITGSGIFGGATTSGFATYAIIANPAYAATAGIISYSSQIFNFAVGGYASGGAFGGFFSSSGSQAALACAATGAGAALQVGGPMTIDSSTLVTNLNADLLDNFQGSAYTRTFATNSGDATPSNSRIVLNGNTSTGIAGAYVGTSGSADTVIFTIQTTSPSDVKLKQEIQDTDLGLEFVNKLRPVSYKLKADPKQQKGYGFIADEVEELIGLDSSLIYYEPDWQVGDQKGFKVIHYPSYIAVLTKAIQELSAEVAALKAKG
jgi:hypothetical protein